MAEPFLVLDGMSKRYGAVLALADASLTVAPAEVVGLIGENGAGKSTLMRMLGGVIAPTTGTIIIDGTVHERMTVQSAAAAGIAFVHQELNLFENLDVASNIFIGRETLRFGPLRLVDQGDMRRRSAEILGTLGVDFTPDALVETLSIAQRQMIEIAKALSQRARLIIMDEPTSSLTLAETERLLKVIERLRASGVAIIYISHRLNEIQMIADRVVALRDGRRVGELSRQEMSHGAMIRLMIGRDLKALYTPPAAPPRAGGLKVRGLVTPSFPERSVDFDVHRGEIVGVAGLIGAGRTEVAEAVFGVAPPLAGEIRLDDRPLSVRCVHDALSRGIYLVPEDRKGCGLVVENSVAENITLPNLRYFAQAGLIDTAAERQVAEVQRRALGIKTPSLDAPAMTLSGGNQQKIVLAKWLAMEPSVMIFDEPTRGIDVGAKSEIYRIMRSLADSGVAVMMISSDMEEVIGVSDRLIVMHEGAISGHLARKDFSEHNVMVLATGQPLPEETAA